MTSLSLTSLSARYAGEWAERALTANSALDMPHLGRAMAEMDRARRVPTYTCDDHVLVVRCSWTRTIRFCLQQSEARDIQRDIRRQSSLGPFPRVARGR